MNKNIPCYQLQIDESLESEVQVNYVALVDLPAIEKNFLAFRQDEGAGKWNLNFASINEEERIVLGAAMIPDQPIYRNDPEMGEYYVQFSKETVKVIAEKFYAKSFQNNANLMHDENQKTEGVCFFMSFIRDTTKGMIGLEGDYPEGTWFLGAKINNEDVWNKVKAGEVKGFSVEGIFQYKKEKHSAHRNEEILNGLESLSAEDLKLLEKILEKIPEA